MPREEVENYKQDRLGNSRREIDKLRAREGSEGGSEDDGLLNASAGAGVEVLYSMPTHAQQVILEQVQAYNSDNAQGDTVQLFECELDGSGSITSSTPRSVPIQVQSAKTRIENYVGKPFQKAIGVDSDFNGTVAVGVVSDHHEENEPASEMTGTPGS